MSDETTTTLQPIEPGPYPYEPEPVDGEVFCAAIGCNPCDFIWYPEYWPFGQPAPSDEELMVCTTTTSTSISVEQPVFMEPLPRTGIGFMGACFIVAAILQVIGGYLVRKSK